MFTICTDVESDIFMDCAGRAKRRQRFSNILKFPKSGVALCLPPQSK